MFRRGKLANERERLNWQRKSYVYGIANSILMRSELVNFYSNSSMTISGFDPNRSGGPQVPAPLEVKTCIFPILLRP